LKDYQYKFHEKQVTGILSAIILSCIGVYVTYKTGSELDLLTPDTHHSELQAITALSLIYTLNSPPHRYTCIRVLSLHSPYPGNGFITV
jgi:hypothetical protein